MAEKRPPGFNVDLEFYDSDEVMSLPRRIRPAAIGVWTLAGSYSAKKLSDGLVGAEVLKQLGCTPAIRTALMSTTKHDGTPSPLWEDAGNGAIRFTKWTKWQRTEAEVTTWRAAEAERKRVERAAKKAAREARSSQSQALPEAYVDATQASRESHVDAGNELPNPPRNGATRDYAEMSGRTSVGPSTKSGDQRTENREQRTTSGHLTESATDSTARDAVAATPGAELVRRVIPRDTPAPTQTGLRIAASELVNTGTPPDVVEEALRDWASRTGIGPGVLASLAADVLKRRNNAAAAPFGGAPAANGFGGRASSKAQSILDGAEALIAARSTQSNRPAIES